MDTIKEIKNIIKNDKHNKFQLNDHIKHINYYLKQHSSDDCGRTITVHELEELFQMLEDRSDQSSGPFYT